MSSNKIIKLPNTYYFEVQKIQDLKQEDDLLQPLGQIADLLGQIDNHCQNKN